MKAKNVQFFLYGRENYKTIEKVKKSKFKLSTKLGKIKKLNMIKGATRFAKGGMGFKNFV